MAGIVQADVLVIGGGGAAARAALEARLAGAEVVLAVKGSFGAIGTRGAGATASAMSEFGMFATPGWTGPLSKGETPFASRYFGSPDNDFGDIIQVGLGMADPKLARIVVEDAVAARTALLNWGADIGAHGVGSHGVPIVSALASQIRRAGVSLRDRTMMVSLLVQDGECLGAVGIDETSGDTVVIKAGATVVATGGDANLFMLNLNPPCNTGDGYAMGYEAGAELMNLEFKQVFLGTVYPTRNMLLRFLPPHVKLTNATGQEFLQNYLPPGATPGECLAQRHLHNPFSTRDTLSRYVDIGIVTEVKAGRGTQHHGIYLDRTDPRCPRLPTPRREFWLYRGIDWDKGPVEVGVCHHCSLGGFRINENAQTTLPRLYAAGEVTAGPHGADRMGGHMLLASQVFGARAGRHSARIKGQRVPDIGSKVLAAAEERIKALRDKKGDRSPAAVKRTLQEAAYFNLLVIRSHHSLNRLLAEVKAMNEEQMPRLSAANPEELVEALELQNLLLLAELEANICLMRTESRGPHYREDFPKPDGRNWLKSITAKKVGGKLQLGTITLDPSWRSKDEGGVRDWG